MGHVHTVAFSVMFIVSATCLPDELSAPVLIVFDSAGATPEKQLEYFRLVNEFCPAEFVRPVDDALIARIQNVFHKFDDPDGFEHVGGLAHCLERDGRFSVVRFRTVQSRDTFENFVAMHAAKRGETVKLSRSGDSILMTDGGPGKTSASGAVVRWIDAYFSYSHGVVAWGDKEAFLTPFSKLSAMANKGAGHDWCVYAAPSAVPQQYRAQFLAQVERQAGVLLQERDHEDRADYTIRRQLGDHTLEILRRGFSDIDEFLLFTDEPGADQGFHAHLEIAIREKSRLAKLVQELRPIHVSGLDIDPNAVASAELTVGIPEALRPVLHSLVANSQFSGTPASDALNRAIQSGTVEAGFSLVVDSNGEPSIEGTVIAAATEVESTSMATLLGGTLLPDGDFEIPVTGEILCENFQTYRLTYGRMDDRNIFRANPLHANEIAESVAHDRSVGVEKDAGKTQNTLLKMDIDLQQLAELEPDGRMKQLIVQAERMYQCYMGRQYPQFLRRRGAEPLDEFVSLVPGIRKEGDWTLHLEVWCSRDGDRIMADCHIGRELYGISQARRIVTQRPVFRIDRAKVQSSQ